MKESKCPIDSSSSNDREAARTHQRGNHLLSDICKYLEVTPDRKSSRENVELGLEIEINESLKRVLTTPNSGSDDLLDVTIIRPSESDVAHETTVALNKEEVRDFITLVEQHHQNRLKSSAKPKKSNKHKDDVPDHIPTKHPKQTKDGGNRKTKLPETNSEDTKSGGSSKSQRGEKPGTPCVCQHCGIMGVLVQSHKAQVNDLSRSPEDRKEDRRRKRERSADRSKEDNKSQVREAKESKESRDAKNQRIVESSSGRSIDQVELLREINTRIKNLEKRIAVQEETAVPKDYLKHVLHKVLTQYRVQTEQQPKAQNFRNTGTQYFVETKEKYPTQQRKDSKGGRNYQVHTLLHTPTMPTTSPKVEVGEPSNASRETASRETVNAEPASKSKKEPVYFWGEEIVTPGCDLKTKILNLLEERIRKVETSHTEPTKPFHQSKIPIALPEKLPKQEVQPEIRVERDENLLFLGKMDEIPPCNIDDYIQRSKLPELIKPLPGDKNVHNQIKPQNTAISVVPESLRPDSKDKQLLRPTTAKGTRNNLRSMLNPSKPQYPFDPKRTSDDSTFRKNIEAQKEKLKEKPKMVEKFFNAYAAQSATTESKASMEYVLQKLKNNKIMETGLPKQKEKEIDDRFKVTQYEKLAGSIIKENMTAKGFRGRKPIQEDNEDMLSVPVDVTYINPRITHWSEESTASEDKYMKYMKPTERRETLPVETKESLIYKLEFLKNLAKHKSADQSKVLNKIWTQAKKTAKSKNDAVFIKIPFKSVNTVEPRNNVIEMQLTLEQLETVVQSVKVNGSTSKVANYKSSSEIDLGQRKHEEIRKANMEVLNKRKHLSAKTNRNKK